MNEKQSFVFFCAIFWGVILTSISKLAPFGIDGFREGKGRQEIVENFKRYGLGLVILNVLPAIWFSFLLQLDFVVPKGNTFLEILAGAFAALSMFAFLNLGYVVFDAKDGGSIVGWVDGFIVNPTKSPPTPLFQRGEPDGMNRTGTLGAVFGGRIRS